MIFKKKTASDVVAENRKLIQNNSEKIGKLVMLVNDDNLIVKLKDLQEKLKYLMPAKTKEDTQIDKRIADKIDDLKTEIARHGDSPNRIENVISEILLLLVNRN